MKNLAHMKASKVDSVAVFVLAASVFSLALATSALVVLTAMLVWR